MGEKQADMEGKELLAFQIIASVGSARSSYISAIDLASEQRFDEAMASIEEGKREFGEGHAAHAKLLAASAGGAGGEMDLLLAHAEDQLMSAETFGILAERFYALYQKLAHMG